MDRRGVIEWKWMLSRRADGRLGTSLTIDEMDGRTVFMGRHGKVGCTMAGRKSQMAVDGRRSYCHTMDVVIAVVREGGKEQIKSMFQRDGNSPDDKNWASMSNRHNQLRGNHRHRTCRMGKRDQNKR
eukprot:scaffold42790_cov38-Cyclotella_meneghiniana.AAC.2